MSKKENRRAVSYMTGGQPLFDIRLTATQFPKSFVLNQSLLSVVLS
jgi:hypothetical protein